MTDIEVPGKPVNESTETTKEIIPDQPVTRTVRYNGRSGAVIEAAGFTWNVNATDPKHDGYPAKGLPTEVADNLVHEHGALFFFEE